MPTFVSATRSAVRCAALFSIALVLALVPASGRATAQSVSRHVHCRDHVYDSEVYSPDTSKRLPAILLLHGAGGDRREMLAAWQPLAAREGIVLIAPQLPRALWFEAIAPEAFRCIIADARVTALVDPRRIYLFGYSMGGYLAYDGALLDSRYYAGAAVYAAAIADDFYPIVDRAARKIPFAIYIGTHDQFYPIDQVRRTRDSLTSRGFPVHYLEFPDQDHYFAPVADQVMSDAWRYLSAFSLPER